MKILFISNKDDKFGAPKSMLELIETLKKNYSIEPIVITSCYNNINARCEELRIENYVTKHRDFMIPSCKNKFKFLAKYCIKYIQYKIGKSRSQRLIKKYINMDEIDYIHSNSTVIDIGAILAKKYNKKHIWHIREFGDKDYNFIAFRKNYINFMNKNTSRFIAISDAVKENWIKRGIDENKITTVYNGIDLKGIQEREEEKNNEQLKMVITGSICETKGQIQVIKAIEILSQDIKEKITLDIIGEGNEKYENSLKDYVKKVKLEDNIKFLGYRSNVKELLKNYDVGIMASKSEGFGRVTVEYMAAKLCVIASNTGANNEIITDRENGIIYKYNDIKDLANSIEFIYNNRNNYLNKYSEKAQLRVYNNFTTEINARNVYNIYTKVME